MLDKRLVKDNFADRQGKHNRALRRKEKDPNASLYICYIRKKYNKQGRVK